MEFLEQELDEKRLQRAVGACLTTRRLDALWSLGDPATVVPTLPSSAVYLLARLADHEDRQILLLHADVEQVQCCWDMDTWRRDRFEPSGADAWISGLLELPDEAWLAKVPGLLPDGFGLYLLSRAVIYNLKLEPECPEDSVWYTTPDGYFELQPLPDTPEDAWNNLLRFVDRWYEHDATAIQRLLLGTIMELPCALEEESYRLRNGRIRDEGFWDVHQAREIYTPVDPSRIRLESDDAPLEPLSVRSYLPVTRPSPGVDPLSLAMGDLSPEEQDAALGNLALLCNRMTAADEVDIGDESALADVLARARAGVNLGIAYFARHRSRSPGEVLRRVHLSRLFQCGYHLQRQGAVLAATLMRTGVVSLSPGTATLLEEPWSAFLAGLLAPHPLLDWAPAGQHRPVAPSTLEELALITELVEEMSVFKGICFEVLGMPAVLLTEEGAARTSRKTPGAITFGDLLRTAAVALVVKGKASAVPLSAPAARAFLADPAGPGLARQALATRLAAVVALTPQRIARVVDTHLEALDGARDPEQVLLLVRRPAKKSSTPPIG
jgi:hypothetical protein